LNLPRSTTQDFESRTTRMGEFHEYCPLFSNQIRAIRPFATFVFQNCPKVPTDLTPNTNCGKLAKRRNPDQDAHKDALLESIQGPSLAAADLNALGTGGCAWAEPILHGSALAFLTLGTLCENIPIAWRGTMVFFDNRRVSQAVQADGTRSFAGKGAISQTPIPRHDIARYC